MKWKVVIALAAVAAGGNLNSAHAQIRAEIGVGNIVDTLDYTTESFNVYRFFKEHPLELRGDTVAPRFVDYPGESHLAITGVVGSKIERRAESHTNWMMEQSTEVRFRYEHELSFTVWRDGKKLKTIVSSCSGEIGNDAKGKFDDIRYASLSECLDSARTQIISSLSAEGGA